ncbi:branched-chain amino acid transport system II carrier protein [Clostridium sp. A1-XYC3]|uniref:Branched-chain amino acid transport system carrier protein n=1 Tax=Clostridium tanneri TaxID=3037988 RepID=A0ABU4JN93_9CLOT|nr:branched-chain amino acid transport system II carrier protein [Clostridium sp. A1-XYC3]MDW8799607.1 branched-chain amino acid transport system II carrier protein [Clostridium sp. A1-XYC3]
MKNSTKNALVIGFALFAMFFGAGNLIFPPYLGKAVGASYGTAIIGFLITGVGLPLSGVIACAMINGSFEDMANRVGKTFSVIATIGLILAIGPMLAIPRTAATTFELGVHPIFPSVSPIISVIVYFGITLFFVLRPSSLIDDIGKILTPALLVMLAIIIVKGIIDPIGPVVATDYKNVFSSSLLEGYQTMDAMASVIFASMILTSVRSKGYSTPKDVMMMTIKSAGVAVAGLAFVYGGLTYLGSQTSTLFPADIARTTLVTEIVKLDLGSIGSVILGLAVGLACLTTAIGLVSTGAEFFSKLTKGKVSYKVFAILISLVSGVIATQNVDKIVALAVPVLQILYPIVIVLIIMTLLGKKVKSDKIVAITTYVTLVVSVLDTINLLTANKIGFISGIVNAIPLAKAGFSWLIPAVAAFIIASVVVKSDSGKNIKENIA